MYESEAPTCFSIRSAVRNQFCTENSGSKKGSAAALTICSTLMGLSKSAARPAKAIGDVDGAV